MSMTWLRHKLKIEGTIDIDIEEERVFPKLQPLESKGHVSINKNIAKTYNKQKTNRIWNCWQTRLKISKDPPPENILFFCSP